MKTYFWSLLFLATGLSTNTYAFENGVSFDAMVNETTAAEAFTGYGAIYNDSSPSFRCNYYDERSAIKLAEDAADKACYRRGFSSCILRHSSIDKNGYLGYDSRFEKNLGWGCTATAIVHGQY